MDTEGQLNFCESEVVSGFSSMWGSVPQPVLFKGQLNVFSELEAPLLVLPLYI